MKKISAILLALVLVLALSTSAFAASITITPPTLPDGATETGITYTAYKIFDATLSDTGVPAYSIKKDSPYYDTVKNSGYFTLTQTAGDENVYLVVKNDSYTEAVADTFADTLKAVSATAVGTLTKQDDGSYKIDNLDNGYYLVTSSVGTDLILKTIGDVEVESKNDYPSLEKKIVAANGLVDSITADGGATITYAIKVTIPVDAVGEIVVHDDMTNLTYVDMTAVEGITVTTGAADGCEVHFTLSADCVNANKGSYVTINYTANFTGQETAANDAWLVDGSYTSVKDHTDVYTTDVVIDKVDKADNTTKLAGATFVLKNLAGKFYKLDNGVVTWVDAQADATPYVTTDAGAAEFVNIADGTYYLIETVAPAGYNLLTAPVEVVVAASNGTTVDVTAKVENSTGSELPSTGGIGTTIFYVVGSLMMAAAIILLASKKIVASGK